MCSKLGFVWLHLLLLVKAASSKKTSGDFKLSGLNTEYVLGSFAVSPEKMGYMKVKLTSKDPYQMNKDLSVRLIGDEEWSRFQKAPSCTEKVPFSTINEHLTQQRKGNKYEAEIAMPLNNKKSKRPKYFYFVVTDCSLEFYMHDDAIPKMHYSMETWNDVRLEWGRRLIFILGVVVPHFFFSSFAIFSGFYTLC